MLVAGLDGGAEGGPDDGPVAESNGAALASIGGSSVEVGAFTGGDGFRDGTRLAGLDDGGFEVVSLVTLIGGVAIVVRSGGTGGGAVLLGRGGSAALTTLEGGPLGGGGVGAVAVLPSGSFLLTHLFFSES